MEHAYLTVIVLLHLGFASIFLFLNMQRPSKFLHYFALAWVTEALRAMVLVAANVGVQMPEWVWTAQALAYVPVTWLLFAGAADFIGRAVSERASAFYFGLSTALVLANYFTGPYVASLPGWNQESVIFHSTLFTLLVLFVPGGLVRLWIMLRLFRYWRTTAWPGALLASLSFGPHALGSFLVPPQWYLGYTPLESYLFWFLQILGISIGSVMLVLNKQNAEQEEALSLLRSTLDSTADGILVVDEKGKILTFNQTFVDIWKIPPLIVEEGEDQQAINFVLDQLMDPQAFTQRISELYGQPEAEGHDLLEFKDGRILERYSQPRRVGGKSLGRVWSFRDITERKRSEEFRLAKEAAESASAAKSGVLAKVSHELRTPLNSIIGFSNILRKNSTGNLRPRDLFYLERIHYSGKHLLGLINDLLDIARLESGRMNVEITSVCLDSLVEDVIVGLAVDRKETIKVITELPRPIAPFQTDEGKLRQILTNLIGNALKFTEEGHVRIRVGVDDASRKPCYIEVMDTGIGIPSDRLETIFEPFQQADAHTAVRYGGSGLGLSICQSLCDLMCYHLEVKSEPGKGSVFKLVFQGNILQPGGDTLPAGLAVEQPSRTQH